MFHTSDYQQRVSLTLSEILDDIGCNEKMVLKRRRAQIMEETMMIFIDRHEKVSSHVFGSASEGTSTYGLNSDCDLLMCDHDYNIIQEYAEWKAGIKNLLMIQDDTVSPGYCHLQLLRDDAPLPEIHVLSDIYIKDAYGRLLLKNTLFQDERPDDTYLHGPSITRQGKLGIADIDYVLSFPCKSWPYQARTWLERKGIGQWPTAGMKRYAANTGCFVVPVSSKLSHTPELEWRISTSLAERCLMFNLNITQIRCYVLMKMILKTFLLHPGEGQISSFMCKTVLLHCIENTLASAWKESNLLICLLCCLRVLYNYLQQENCPHFIIPGNNLMAGQYSCEIKVLLLEMLSGVIQSKGQELLLIDIDDLGQRMRIKLHMFDRTTRDVDSKWSNCLCLSGELLTNEAVTIAKCCKDIMFRTLSDSDQYGLTIDRFIKLLMSYIEYYRDGSRLEQKAISLLVPMVCSTVGSIFASFNIAKDKTVSRGAKIWLSAAMDSDVASVRLKLASISYSVGKMKKTKRILRDIKERYSPDIVEPICGCYNFSIPEISTTFMEVAYQENEEAIRKVCAFCVTFTNAEINCIPHELKYEMFRSTDDDLEERESTQSWMDWAVVDCLPYLYFLQYKTYGHLQKFNKQEQALSNLIGTITKQKNLGHRETALNLLGQCMEQEDLPNEALNCYMLALKVRDRNNIARLHICRLIAKLIRDKTDVQQAQ